MGVRLATPGPKRREARTGSPAPRLLVVLVVASVLLLTLSCREGETGPLHAVRGAFQTVTSPVRMVGAAATVPFQGLGNVVTNLTAGQETLTDLKAENERLRAQVAQLSEAEQTTSRLEGLLQLKSAYNLSSTAARVISLSTDSWSSTATIDKGSASGIAIGMPVTTSSGVIGQVSECGPTSATVRLLADERSGVAAMAQSTRAQGQVSGSPDGSLHLSLVRTDQQVGVGDSIVTSGLGGVYPKGLPIGTVASVETKTGSMYYDISVTPLAQLTGFEEVLVITSVGDDQKASSEDAAAANAQEGVEPRTEAATTQAAAGDAEGAPADDEGGEGQ